MEPNSTLPLNRSRSTQSHRLYKLSSTGVSDAFYSKINKDQRRQRLLIQTAKIVTIMHESAV